MGLCNRESDVMRGTVAERFNAKVDRSKDCWIWMAAKCSKQYGQLRVAGKNVAAHRLAWELANGQAPPADKQVCHHCDNPSCVRPDHRFLGTNQENADDMVAKGRAYNQKKKACIHGHPFDEANTYISADGRRSCNTCREARAAKYFRDACRNDIAGVRAKGRAAATRRRERLRQQQVAA